MLATEAPEAEISQSPKGAAAAVLSPKGTLPAHPDQFARRHIGPGAEATRQMLDLLGYPSLEGLINDAVPAPIRLARPLEIPGGRSEHEVLAALREIASQNQVFRSFIGMGTA